MKDKQIQAAIKYIQSWLPYKFDRSDLPGMSVAVSHKSKIIFSGAYGYADVESKKKMTANHAFRVASHSKTFTAVAIMQLQEKGKLKLDDPIIKYLPWLEKHKDKRWQKVTLRQVLSHRAGIIRDGANADYWLVEREFPTEEHFKQEILASDLVFDTNLVQKYSNYGFTLLGQVVASASGEAYNLYVEKNIIEVLRLKNTTPELVESNIEIYATGYSRKEPNKRFPVAHSSSGIMSSAAGYCSTPGDLCQYFSEHFMGSKRLLDDESKKEMQRTQGLDRGMDGNFSMYGLGLRINYLGERILFGHSGGYPGFITKTYFDPENKFVVSVMINCTDAPADEATKGILSVIYKFLDESGKQKHDISKLEKRFACLWMTCDIVTLGKQIYATSPDTWQPFLGAEELEYIDDKTLKIKKADWSSSPGEAIKLIEDGVINYAGFTMSGIGKYRSQLASKSKIG